MINVFAFSRDLSSQNGTIFATQQLMLWSAEIRKKKKIVSKCI